MERRMARDLDRYITGNYGEKQMELPAHTCVDRPHLPCDACEEDGEAPFGWWDSFNEVLYRNENDAKLAEAGGNQITPLFTRGQK